MAILEVKNLNLGFENRTLIQNLSFRLESPSFLAIIGHNGCGKSTFLRTVVNQQTFQGDLILNGQPILVQPDLIKDGYVTLLSQKNSVNFSIRVKDLVLMGRFRFKKLFQNYSKSDEEIVLNTLEQLSIQHLCDKDFLELSGGEQQLVWLAQVMVQDTQVVLLDEPSQQLDVYNRKKIFDTMQLMAFERNKMVICITHDLTNLAELKGFVLNLSRKVPQLISISPDVIQEEIQFLEQQPAGRF